MAISLINTRRMPVLLTLMIIFLTVESGRSESESGASKYADIGDFFVSSRAKEGEVCQFSPKCWGAAACYAPKCEEGLICTRKPSLKYCCGVCKKASDIDSKRLLIGKLISQGSNRNEVVGSARTKVMSSSEIEEVNGKEIAESARQYIQPGNQLEVGRLVKEYKQKPLDAQVRANIDKTLGKEIMYERPIEKKQGKVLDQDVQTGRLVPNPVKVLAEIKSNGENIETVEGKIVAGDSGDINVVKIKGDWTLNGRCCWCFDSNGKYWWQRLDFGEMVGRCSE